MSLLRKLKNQQHISDDQIIYCSFFYSPVSLIPGQVLCILHLFWHEIFTILHLLLFLLRWFLFSPFCFAKRPCSVRILLLSFRFSFLRTAQLLQVSRWAFSTAGCNWSRAPSAAGSCEIIGTEERPAEGNSASSTSSSSAANGSASSTDCASGWLLVLGEFSSMTCAGTTVVLHEAALVLASLIAFDFGSSLVVSEPCLDIKALIVWKQKKIKTGLEAGSKLWTTSFIRDTNIKCFPHHSLVSFR